MILLDSPLLGSLYFHLERRLRQVKSLREIDVNLPQKTRAAVLYRLNEPLVVEELDVPALQPGQVLVEMAWSGICQTQLLEVRGKKGEDKHLPHTLGHEGSAQVLAVGEGVKNVKPGDHVVLSWIKGPGQNAPAPKYKNKNGQVVNAGQVATFTQYGVVSENRCTVISRSLPQDVAALLGCAVPTGAGVVINQMKAKAGQSLAVFGVGGIGASAVLAGVLSGCNPVIAIDVNEEKLRFAQKLGATHLIDASGQDVGAALQAIVKGGVDFALESSGNKTAMEVAHQSVRDGGGLLVIAGNLAHGETIKLDPFHFIRGKNILGTAGGQTAPEKDLPRYATLQIGGQFPFQLLIGRSYALTEINQAFDDLEQGTVGRLMIHF